jgi:hypothetical protein
MYCDLLQFSEGACLAAAICSTAEDVDAKEHVGRSAAGSSGD